MKSRKDSPNSFSGGKTALYSKLKGGTERLEAIEEPNISKYPLHCHCSMCFFFAPTALL